MSKVYTDPQNYNNIAAAIRTKLGGADTYKPNEMAQAILSIETEPTIEPLTVTENGTYPAPAGVDGYSPVTVECTPTIQPLTVTENGTYRVPAGVDGYSPVNVNVAGGERNADIHWYLPKICVGDPLVTVHSDCELKDPLDDTDYTHSANILTLTKTGELDIKLTLDKDNMAAGDGVTFSGNYTAYKFQNGTADGLSVTVQPFTAKDTYESLLSAPYKRNVLARMTVIRNNSYMDSGSDTASFTISFPRVGIGGSDANSVSVNADSYINVSGLQINMNQRDASVYYVWKEEGQCDSISYMKVRWKGASHYNASIDQEWEAIFLSNGDVILRMIKLGSYSGSFQFYGHSFSIIENQTLCFYRKDYWGTNWDSYEEEYNYAHHHDESATLYKVAAFADYASAVSEGSCCINNVAYDDNTYTISLDSSFTWHSASTVVASGNSWMGIGGSSENVKMHRRDAKMWYLYICYFTLTDMNNMKAVYVSWRGASHYNISIDRWWTLWLFENGDAMIYISTIGSNTGECSFFGQSYTGANNSFISFYYNSSTGSYDIKYEQYTLEHHIT